jgi:hypothetical protein
MSAACAAKIASIQSSAQAASALIGAGNSKSSRTSASIKPAGSRTSSHPIARAAPLMV